MRASSIMITSHSVSQWVSQPIEKKRDVCFTRKYFTVNMNIVHAAQYIKLCMCVLFTIWSHKSRMFNRLAKINWKKARAHTLTCSHGIQKNTKIQNGNTRTVVILAIERFRIFARQRLLVHVVFRFEQPQQRSSYSIEHFGYRVFVYLIGFDIRRS